MNRPTPEEIEREQQKTRERKEAGFRAWIESPMVKLTLSMIPPASNAEAMQMLLKSCFEAGFAAGTGDIMQAIVESLLKDRGPK